MRCEVVVDAKVPVLGVLKELPREVQHVSIVQGSVIVESHLLRPDHRQLQRDREVVLLAVELARVGLRSKRASASIQRDRKKWVAPS